MKLRLALLVSAMLATACGSGDQVSAPEFAQCNPETCGGGGEGGGGGSAFKVEIIGNMTPWGPGACTSYIAYRTGGTGQENQTVSWTITDNRINRFQAQSTTQGITQTLASADPVIVCGVHHASSNIQGYGYVHLKAAWQTAFADSVIEWGQTVDGLQPASVAVVPASATIKKGEQKALQAFGIDQYSNQRDKTASAMWASSDNAIATVQSGGFIPGTVFGTGRGVAQITATVHGRVSNAAPITVRAVTTVTVSPASSTVLEGGNRQLTATTLDQFGQPITGWSAAWSSSNNGIATVNSSGLAHGVAAGQVTITATADGVQGTATVTVDAAPRLTSFSTNPSPPVQYTPATYQVIGENFDPASMELVFIGYDLTNCFVWWNIPCEATIPNGSLSVKTSTLLVAANQVFSGYGSYEVFVRNTATGYVTGRAPLTIVPLY